MSSSKAKAKELVDVVAEKVNKSIDDDIASLMDSFRDIVGLAAIRDKDAYQATQDGIEAEARAHNMVRAAQSLTLLSHALKLSLVNSLEVVDSSSAEVQHHSSSSHETISTSTHFVPTTVTPNEEARRLICATKEERKKCFQLLALLGLEQVFDAVEVEQESEGESRSDEEVESFTGDRGAAAIAGLVSAAQRDSLVIGQDAEPAAESSESVPAQQPSSAPQAGASNANETAVQSGTQTAQADDVMAELDDRTSETLGTPPKRSDDGEVEEDAEMEDVEVG
ncbi:Surfeit family protein 5 [Ceraceosorus bombacis]|uniref:Surfeit family protein 5 n=1 Tax=Ceraceosorus bombacis TaxID=401625 RepID=A0A0N7LBF3_9BASI|nr:Surfeit family protein 5 [Ceraceosorus bombacis]